MIDDGHGEQCKVVTADFVNRSSKAGGSAFFTAQSCFTQTADEIGYDGSQNTEIVNKQEEKHLKWENWKVEISKRQERNFYGMGMEKGCCKVSDCNIPFWCDNTKDGLNSRQQRGARHRL